MKKEISDVILIFLTFMLLFTGCKEEEATIVTGEVIPPIIKYVSMPSQSNTIPSTDIYIEGVGFSKEDIISCKSLEGETDFTSLAVSADNYGIIVSIPDNAGGEYEVSVSRSGLTTVLDKHLFVAFVFTIDNISIPETVAPGESVEIKGVGFESGDQVKFSSVYYPADLDYMVGVVQTDDGITISVPEACYGINNLTVIRGKKTCAIGSIKILVNIGDETGGGIVFYTSDEGVHGLIVAPENVVNEQIFGPSVQVEPYASGTSEAIYSGKENSNILVKGITSWRNAGNSAEPTIAELCSQYSIEVNGVTYDDWFLGSLDEMSVLFNYRATLAEPYAFVPAQNYWTSTVIPGSNWAWAYYYVNFWESTSLVTGAAPCDGWVIAARPIRQF
jgi:hypothetical protein